MKYGEYIKTREAKAESDSQIRRYINRYIKDGFKLIKYKIAKPGTLDYGRAVIMMSRQTSMYNWIWVMKVDFGKLSRIAGTGHYPIKSYRLKTVAEKKYNEYIKYFLGS